MSSSVSNSIKPDMVADELVVSDDLPFKVYDFGPRDVDAETVQHTDLHPYQKQAIDNMRNLIAGMLQRGDHARTEHTIKVSPRGRGEGVGPLERLGQMANGSGDNMVTLFKDGQVQNEQSLEDIRNKALQGGREGVLIYWDALGGPTEGVGELPTNLEGRGHG